MDLSMLSEKMAAGHEKMTGRHKKNDCGTRENDYETENNYLYVNIIKKRVHYEWKNCCSKTA
jgi:hypothetical protein